MKEDNNASDPVFGLKKIREIGIVNLIMLILLFTMLPSALYRHLDYFQTWYFITYLGGEPTDNLYFPLLLMFASVFFIFIEIVLYSFKMGYLSFIPESNKGNLVIDIISPNLAYLNYVRKISEEIESPRNKKLAIFSSVIHLLKSILFIVLAILVLDNLFGFYSVINGRIYVAIFGFQALTIYVTYYWIFLISLASLLFILTLIFLIAISFLKRNLKKYLLMV